MTNFITVVHIVVCVVLVLVVLIQSGKGAEISATFSGSSQTVFGSSGGANFFTRFTSAAAALFMITSLALTVIGSTGRKSVFDAVAPPPAATATPAVEAGKSGESVPAQQTAPAPAPKNEKGEMNKKVKP